MNGMALAAVRGFYLCGMRLVALQTFRFFPVNIVAVGAAERRVLALVLTKLLNLFGMACEARIRHVRRKSDLQRRMRIFMTVETAFDFEMRFALVTHIALRNIVLGCRAVTGVAVLTGNRFVLPSIRINLRRLIGMTFGAVAGIE
jgi:hypothetical protein